jgi:hypothetical protein
MLRVIHCGRSLAASLSSAADPPGVPTFGTSLAWFAWGASKSSSDIHERLLVSQRHHGVDFGRAARGDVTVC